MGVFVAADALLFYFLLGTGFKFLLTSFVRNGAEREGLPVTFKFFIYTLWVPC